MQHNISGNLITVLTLVELITTDLLHKHHTTPELNLKTNQGVRDYAAGLALHLNDGRRTDDAGTKCGVCMRKCLSARGFFFSSRGVRRWESKKKNGHQFNTRALSDLATAPLSQSHWEFGLRAPDLARSLQRHVSQSVGLLLPIPNWNGCYCSQCQFGALVHWRYSLRLSHKVWRPLSVWSPYVTGAN